MTENTEITVDPQKVIAAFRQSNQDLLDQLTMYKAYAAELEEKLTELQQNTQNQKSVE